MTIQSVGLLDAIKTPANPFPGLRPFESNESHLFFGRDEQIGKLLAKFAQTRFLAVVGTSGSGKSSLVRAGLIPALRSGMLPNAKGKWRIAVMRPSNDPIGNLVRALNAPDVFGSAEPENEAIQQAITGATLRLGSRGLIEVANQNLMTGDENLLVLVDQFEELFRYLREARKAKNPQAENDAADFVKLLLESVKDKANIYVVITMRSDFLGDCSQFPDFPEAITESQYLIPRLTRDQLREVIEGPVAVGGGQITSHLVNQLLNDVTDDQDQLPILQHALMRTWDERQQPRHQHLSQPDNIDLCCYEAIGSMAQALSHHADEAFNEIHAHGQKATEKIFKALTEKSEDGRVTRRPVTVKELSEVAEATEDSVTSIIEIFRLAGRSFLLPSAETPLHSESLIDISHESLIRVWERLQQWVDEEYESATIYRRLFQTAKLYELGKSELWRGADLQVGLEWKQENNPTITWANRYLSGFEIVTSFLFASEQRRNEEEAALKRQQMEEAERTKRELEQAQELARLQEEGFGIFHELGQSTYNLTHRLGNDLGLVTFYVSEVRSVLADQKIFIPTIDATLDKIINDVGRVLNMSKGLKAKLANSQSAEVASQSPSEVSITKILKEAMWASPPAPSKIQLSWEKIDERLKVKVVTGQIIEIISTLIANAIEAMPNGGKIVVNAYKSNKDVCIEVSDDGPGISKANQKKIFNLFFSTKNSAGFGLWSAHRYARANGGDLTMKSGLGKGATFILTLPIIVSEDETPNRNNNV